jgi:hypothetical protein
MKRIVATIILLGSMVFAQEVLNPSNMKMMKDLEKAVALIQKGFMYNNVNVVENGVREVKSLVANSNAFKLDGTKAKKGFDPNKYAQEEAKGMGELADKILAQFKSDEKDKVIQTHMVMINKCVNCHKIVRKW